GAVKKPISLTVTPERVNPGGSVTVEAAGFGPRERVTVSTSAGGLKLDERTVDCDETGSFRAVNAIPSIAPAGTFELTARGAAGTFRAAAARRGGRTRARAPGHQDRPVAGGRAAGGQGGAAGRAGGPRRRAPRRRPGRAGRPTTRRTGRRRAAPRRVTDD